MSTPGGIALQFLCWKIQSRNEAIAQLESTLLNNLVLISNADIPIYLAESQLCLKNCPRLCCGKLFHL